MGNRYLEIDIHKSIFAQQSSEIDLRKSIFAKRCLLIVIRKSIFRYLLIDLPKSIFAMQFVLRYSNFVTRSSEIDLGESIFANRPLSVPWSCIAHAQQQARSFSCIKDGGKRMLYPI